MEKNVIKSQIPLIGAHVERANPLKGALDRGASVIQINLSAPQSWRAPVMRGDETEIISAGLPIFVHAPYLVNPASINPVLRAKSRVCLQQQTKAAARVGAKGLVVHGGHPTGNGKVEDGIAGWLEVLEGWEPEVPILIENTAGGSAAVARKIESLALLFDALRSAGHDTGFTLDTCHAHAGGLEPDEIIERCLSATGRLDLIHLNDSKDEFGSGRDRHENLGKGKIDPEWLIDIIRECNVPVVVETPNGVDAMRRDVDWVRERF